MVRITSLALILSGQLFSTVVQAASALVPAYIYPSDSTTWAPLYSQIAAQPKVTFTVIINPNSGPGDGIHDTNYLREIATLRQSKNVRLVGYVHTSWATRSYGSVTAEIDTYASWPSVNSSIYVDGIFFDEAPAVAAAGNVTYMQDLVAYVRAKQGAGIGKASATPYVVTNPGYPPETNAYLNSYPAPDLVLVYESSYAAWDGSVAANRQAIWNLDADDNQLAVMLYSVPDSLTCTQITSLANDLKTNVGVGTLWFTDLDGYANWPNNPQFGRYTNTYKTSGKAC